MTLTVEFLSDFYWIPWFDFCWNSGEKDGNNDKVITFGWGSTSFLFTNFSTVATIRRWRLICDTVVDDEKKMDKIDDISTSNVYTKEDVRQLVKRVMLGEE